MRILFGLLLLVVVAFAGAAAQSYFRMKDGPTFVDSLVAQATGRGGELEKLGREADRVLDKAKDAVKDLDQQ